MQDLSLLSVNQYQQFIFFQRRKELGDYQLLSSNGTILLKNLSDIARDETGPLFARAFSRPTRSIKAKLILD